MSEDLQILDAACIGYAAGYASASRDEIAGVFLENRAAELLRVCGIRVSAARRIVECARSDVAAEFPDADPSARRSLAALRVIDAVRNSVHRAAANAARSEKAKAQHVVSNPRAGETSGRSSNEDPPDSKPDNRLVTALAKEAGVSRPTVELEARW